jgi:hypothetical protein
MADVFRIVGPLNSLLGPLAGIFTAGAKPREAASGNLDDVLGHETLRSLHHIEADAVALVTLSGNLVRHFP